MSSWKLTSSGLQRRRSARWPDSRYLNLAAAMTALPPMRVPRVATVVPPSGMLLVDERR